MMYSMIFDFSKVLFIYFFSFFNFCLILVPCQKKMIKYILFYFILFYFLFRGMVNNCFNITINILIFFFKARKKYFLTIKNVAVCNHATVLLKREREKNNYLQYDLFIEKANNSQTIEKHKMCKKHLVKKMDRTLSVNNLKTARSIIRLEPIKQ